MLYLIKEYKNDEEKTSYSIYRASLKAVQIHAKKNRYPYGDKICIYNKEGTLLCERTDRWRKPEREEIGDAKTVGRKPVLIRKKIMSLFLSDLEKEMLDQIKYLFRLCPETEQNEDRALVILDAVENALARKKRK